MMYPQISVIVSIYNTSKYLVQCLDTIVNQTFKNIEVICVNDGSTDGSASILEKFTSMDSRLIVINRETASGSAALPRNIGLDLARGKYVIFLDSDDYFDLTMLEKLYDRAQKTEADLVICNNYKLLGVTGEVTDKNTELYPQNVPDLETFSYIDVPDVIFQISPGAVWNKLILHETLIKHNLKFQLNTPILDDIYVVDLLCILSKRISVLRDRLIFYRYHRDGAQTTKMAKYKESIFWAFYELNKYLIEHSLYEIVKSSLQIWTLATMEWWLHSIDDYKIFCKMCDLYKNNYFNKLCLMDIDPDILSLYDSIRDFYNSILRSEVKPSLKIILESFLMPESKIAIYGAGFAGNNVYNLVKTHGKHKIVIWCDNNADKLANPLIKHPKELVSCDFDVVIIAILDKNVVNEVKTYLTDMGIDAQKMYEIS